MVSPCDNDQHRSFNTTAPRSRCKTADCPIFSNRPKRPVTHGQLTAKEGTPNAARRFGGDRQRSVRYRFRIASSCSEEDEFAYRGDRRRPRRSLFRLSLEKTSP